MALLIWTVTLCLCAAAVTLSHDWRPARLLVANLRHTQGAHCFLNRIVKSLAQGPSKIRRLSKLLITLRDDPSEASWLHLREGYWPASSLACVSRTLGQTIWPNEKFSSLEWSTLNLFLIWVISTTCVKHCGAKALQLLTNWSTNILFNTYHDDYYKDNANNE